jgi:hypothetical protein
MSIPKIIPKKYRPLVMGIIIGMAILTLISVFTVDTNLTEWLKKPLSDVSIGEFIVILLIMYTLHKN